MKLQHRLIIILSALFITASITACVSTKESVSEKQKRQETPSKINTELGLGYMRQGDYLRAMEKLQTALNYDDENPHAHHYMAELNRRLGNFDKAIKHYQVAIELEPTDSGLRNNYGTFLCAQGKYQQADVQFLLAIEDPLFNGRMQSYENAGICAAQGGKSNKAEKYLRKALSSNPKLPVSLYNMSVINFDKAEYLRARAYLQRFEEVAAHSAESLWLGIRIEKQLGDRDIMLKYASELSRRFSGSRQWDNYTRQRWQ